MCLTGWLIPGVPDWLAKSRPIRPAAESDSEYLTEIWSPIDCPSQLPTCGRKSVGSIGFSKGWMSFEGNGLGTAIPDARFGDSIHGPTHGRGPGGSLGRVAHSVTLLVSIQLASSGRPRIITDDHRRGDVTIFLVFRKTPTRGAKGEYSRLS